MSTFQLLTVMLLLTRRDPEPLELRAARLLPVAEALRDAPEWVRPHAISAMFFESRFSRAVHEGTVTGDRGASVCLGQLNKRNAFRIDPVAGLDRDATRRCVDGVVRTLVAGHAHCSKAKDRLQGMHAFYLTGGRCVHSQAPKRAALAQRLPYIVPEPRKADAALFAMVNHEN